MIVAGMTTRSNMIFRLAALPALALALHPCKKNRISFKI